MVKFGCKILENVENIALITFQILYTFVLCAEKCNQISEPDYTFPKSDSTSAHNTKVYKVCKLHRSIFSTFYIVLQPNFTILLNLG